MDKNGTAVSEWYLACPCVGLQLLLMEYAIKELHRCIFFFCMLIQLHCFRSQIHFVFLLQLPLLGPEHYQFSCFCLFFHSAFEGLLSPSSLSYTHQSTSHPNHVSPSSVSGRKSIFWLNSSIFIVLYTDKRSTGLTHWKNAGSDHAMPRPSTAGLHGFYQPDSFRGISSLKSEKKESDYVLLSIREEITP